MTKVRYRNYYCCAQDHAPEFWDDTSDSQNNDRCPICNAETEPYRSEVLGHRANGLMDAALLRQAQMAFASDRGLTPVEARRLIE
jgi:hypothetical protein